MDHTLRREAGSQKDSDFNGALSLHVFHLLGEVMWSQGKIRLQMATNALPFSTS